MSTIINALRGLARAYWGLPLAVRVGGLMIMAAGLAMGTLAVMHYVFHIDTCPWIPPNCPAPK